MVKNVVSGISRRAVMLGSLGLSAALLLTSCSASNDPATSSSSASSPADDERSGGELTFLLTRLTESWQQQDTGDYYTSQVWQQVIDTLTFLDEQGEVHPYLAESWTVDESGTQYDFTIRDGVTFSDGTALTAEVVAENLNLLGLGDEAKGITRNSRFPSAYQNAEATGDLTVRVTLTEPNTGLLGALAGNGAGILSASTIALSKEEQGKIENVAASGPFTFESEEPGQSVTLVRRDDYNWGPQNALHEGPAYLERITYSAVSDASVRQGAVEAGQADILHGTIPSEEVQLEDAGFTVYRSKHLGVAWGLELRNTATGLDDERVRQAIQVGIDRQDVVDTLYSGGWEVATSIFNDNEPGAIDLSEELEYDPERAKSLLDEAGWSQVDGDGFRTKDGQRLSLTIYASPYITTSQADLQLVSQQLARIGVELVIGASDANTYNQLSSADTAIQEAHVVFVEPASGLREFWSETVGAKRLRTGDAEFSALLDQAAASLDWETEAELLAQIQRSAIEKAYYVPVHQIYQTFLAAEQVEDLSSTGLGRIYLYDTYLADK